MKIGETIWHAARLKQDNAEIAKYEKPKPIKTRANYFTVMPATARNIMAVMPYGEDLSNTWTAIANARMFGGKISVGDLFWVDGDKPNATVEEMYGSGASANAVVVSVNCVNQSISIVLVRNKDKTVR